MTRTPRLFLYLALSGISAGSRAQSPAPARPSPPLHRIGLSSLCVTNGEVTETPGGRLLIDTPSSRAVVPGSSSAAAEIRFRYLGPSQGSKPLASGEMRRQIGLKLRAQDSCNLLYAMWHIEPDSRLAVSVKRNPGQSQHAECGARGYVNIKPARSVTMPRIQVNEWHTLRAELQGTQLTVVADGHAVWEGTVGTAIFEFDGPPGFRTDNARCELEYLAGGEGPPVRACRPSPGD